MVEEKRTPSEPQQLAKAMSALSEMEYARLIHFFEKAGPSPPVCHCKCTAGAGAHSTAV